MFTLQPYQQKIVEGLTASESAKLTPLWSRGHTPRLRYDAEIFFPVAWEYTDVQRWLINGPRLWHSVYRVDRITGQYSVHVLFNNRQYLGLDDL